MKDELWTSHICSIQGDPGRKGGRGYVGLNGDKVRYFKLNIAIFCHSSNIDVQTTKLQFCLRKFQIQIYTLHMYVHTFRAHREGLENLAYKDSWYVVNDSGVNNDARETFLTITWKFKLLFRFVNSYG